MKNNFKWFMFGALTVVLCGSLFANYYLITSERPIGYSSEQQAMMDKLVAEVQ